MVNKKDLRGGAEKMREVAQLLSAWASDLEQTVSDDLQVARSTETSELPSGESRRLRSRNGDLEASGEKRSRKKAVEPAEEAAVPAAAAPVEEAAVPAATTRAEIGYEDLRGLLAEKSAAGYRTQVIALIHSFGAEKLSGVDPAHFGELWDAAAGLGESLSTASGGNIERDEITRNKRAPQCGVAPIEGAGPEVDGDA